MRLFDYKPFLIVACLTPAIGLLLVFLTYPLGLGIYLAFTDAQIGTPGEWVGLENFRSLLQAGDVNGAAIGLQKLQKLEPDSARTRELALQVRPGR